MIRLTHGNIIEADAEALVNTVNCVGFMGKGIALQFKKAFPDNFDAYKKACDKGEVQPGRMFVFTTGSMVNPKYIINFPTKRHWRGKSRLEDIESGLLALIREVRDRNIRTIAVPPLGSGLGGLDWNRVRPMIEESFAAAPDVSVQLFEPVGSPDPRRMPVRTARPHLTLARSLFIKLVDQYTQLAYRLTLLEVQKLAYFQQEAGEDLLLNYVASHYGPYAHNLNKVLEALESHYTRGYGDSQKPDQEIELMPGASREADSFLLSHQASIGRLARVGELIDGFETPYGMELLASIHWVATHALTPARDADEAVRLVHDWNDRKRRMFVAGHIRVAWNRLSELSWVEPGS